MAINTRKISGLTELSELNGSEYLMVAKNGRSYKIRTSLLTSDIITNISQVVIEGDEAESPITITTAAGEKFNFTVKNGKKGSQGIKGGQGDPGEDGNSGIAIYNEDIADLIGLIVDSLNDETHTDEELAQMMLSAKQGAVINTKLDNLKEVYCTQIQYDTWVDEGKIDANTKYFIVE